jgi:putative ABC transport system permease protein
MFLALRDLRLARGRFLLMGAVVALISVLAVVLTGLTSGLAADNVSGLRDLPVTHFAFQRGVEGDLYSRSTVPSDAVQQWIRTPGVRRAAAYGNQLAHAKSEQTGKDLDVALFGMEPGSFIAPGPASGRPLGVVPDGVLVSRKIADAGVRIGDTLVVERSGVRLPVIGTVGDEAYSHIAVVYAPLRTWQRIHYGLPGAPPAPAYAQATAIALDASGTPGRGLGFHVLTKSAAYGASPGYTAETGTMRLIQGFLYVISIFVVGAFFVVWTVQRKQEIALVRAIGGSAGYLLRDALSQGGVVLVAATVVGSAAGVALCAAIRSAASNAPITLDTGPLLTAGLLMIVLGLLGTFFAVRRITSVDPLLVLGANR